MKRPLILPISWNGKPQAGDMLISSLLPSTGAQGSEQRHFIVKQRGRILRQAVLYNYNNKSSKSKSKKQFQHGVRIGFSAIKLVKTGLRTTTVT